MFPSALQCKFRRQSEDPSCPNERYLLYREWAHPRSIYKKQPLDLIRWGVVGSTPGGGTQCVTPQHLNVTVLIKTLASQGSWPRVLGFIGQGFYWGLIVWAWLIESLPMWLNLQYHPLPGRWPVICGSELQFSSRVVDLLTWPACTLSHLISTNSLEAHREPLHWHKLSGIVLRSHRK